MDDKLEYDIDNYGTKRWYLKGELHREDGPAVEYKDGEKHWYLNGIPHREDGPAVEYKDGEKHWYLNGKLHRLDGPAIIFADGGKSWYINECNVTKTITKWAKDNGIDLDNLTHEDKALIKLVWADYGR